MKREATIAGLSSEGLALISGSAGAGSSAVVGPTPTDPVEFRKCARDLKTLSAARKHTNGVRKHTNGDNFNEVVATKKVGQYRPRSNNFTQKLVDKVVRKPDGRSRHDLVVRFLELVCPGQPLGMHLTALTSGGRVQKTSAAGSASSHLWRRTEHYT